MPTTLKPTDIVIVGMGAAGGVAALPLAQAGLKVVGLEAGTWLTPKDFAPDELRNNYRAWPQSVQKANREVPTHRPNASAPYSPRPAFHPMMNGVGGTSLHYWAQSWRLSPWDFKVVSETTKRYGASRLPRGSTVEDWPFGIEEIEHYYDIAERELGVSGKAGNIGGTIDRRGNIFEAPRRREYPMPPLRWTDWHDKMAAAATKPRMASVPRAGRDQHARVREPAGLRVSRFLRARRLSRQRERLDGRHHDPEGAENRQPRGRHGGARHRSERRQQRPVTGVTYVKGTEVFFQPASVVLLATYTYENVRTLLLSKSKAFPNGLANNRGQVGRHYMTHATGGSVQALFPENLNNWYGLPAQGVAVDDFADDNFDHSSLDFIGGGNLFVYSDRRPIVAASMTTFGKAPQWGSSWKAFVKQNADRWHGAYMQKTTLPYEDNYLDLDPTVKDPLGMPVCRITADFKDNERKVAAYAADKMEQWYRAAGATDIVRNPLGTMGPSTHAYGGTRMGDNPETNVVNRWGFAHEVPNLGVLGASVMGTSGSHNPTLTVQALAWRTAEYLVKNWTKVV